MTATPDLRYDEVDDDLRDSLRAMLTARCPWPKVLERTESDEPYDPKLWAVLAGEMGLAGLAVPADRGGAGATFRQSAVVLEELGRACAPVPYLGSAVVATRALLACDDRALLGELAAGTTSAALAVPFPTPPGAAPRAAVTTTEDRLSGSVTSVADALPVDVLLVPTGSGLYAVDAAGAGVARTPVVSLDATRQLCDIALDAAPGRRIAAGPRADAAVTAALLAGAALLASEQVGVAQWCLDTTVEYVRTRYQFGRPIGSFQAIKHRLADVWVRLAQARAVARYAVACVAADDPDAPVAAALAQAHCAGVAVTAAEECVQLHGGIGFTWEHPAHLYLKRAKSAALAFGTAERHREALADLIDIPA
jgi:alkylation response protein AidB-like acyl-CoA dehydrogenase